MNTKMKLLIATMIVAVFHTNLSDSEKSDDLQSPCNFSVYAELCDQRMVSDERNMLQNIGEAVNFLYDPKGSIIPLTSFKRKREVKTQIFSDSAKGSQLNNRGFTGPKEENDANVLNILGSAIHFSKQFPLSKERENYVSLEGTKDNNQILDISSRWHLKTLDPLLKTRMINHLAKRSLDGTSLQKANVNKLVEPSPQIYSHSQRDQKFFFKTLLDNKMLISTQESRELTAEKSLESLIKYILEWNLKNCDLIIAIDRSFKDSIVLERLVEFPVIKQIVHVKSPEDLAHLVEWESSNCKGTFLLVSDPEPLIDFGSKYKFQWSYDAKVVIVGLTLESLETFLLTMKGKKTEHIIGVIKDNESQRFKIFMNLLFWGQGLEQVTTWRGHSFNGKADLFPDKISNLRGAILKACMFDVRPLIYTLKDANGTIVARYGRDIVVAEALSEIFNYTLVYVDIAEDWGTLLANGSWTGLVGFLGRDEGQLGLAYLYTTGLDDRHRHHEYSVPFDDDKTCFLTRIQPPLPPWQNPTLPFTAETWIAFMIGLILSGPVFYALVIASSGVGEEDTHYKSLLVSSLYAIGIHFGHPMVVLPKRLSSQIFIAFLLIYSLILSTGYRSNLTSFLTVARTPKRIETFRDLYYSGFSIKGFQWFYNAFNHSGNYYLRKLLERYEIRATFEEIVNDIMSGSSTTINSKALLEMTSTLMRTKNGKPLVRFLKECLSTYSAGIGYQLHSPLKHKFDIVITKLVESGIIRRWSLQASEQYRELVEKEGGVTYYKDDWHTSGDGVIPLGLSHMEGVFAVFAMGYFIATIAFAVEVLSC